MGEVKLTEGQNGGDVEEAYLKVEDHEHQQEGIVVWTIRAMREGCTRIELKKSRSWEPDAAGDRFTCSIEIKSA
jgi:predicted secreted protein